MKIKKGIAFALSFFSIFSVCGCGETNSSGSVSSAQSEYIAASELAAGIGENSLALYVDEKNEVGTYMGFGSEVDPYFLSFVGEGHYTGMGEKHTVEAADWNTYILSSMRDMKLQRIRMMFIDTYYCQTEEQYTNKTYDWNSDKMKDVYLILDTAQELGISVNVTLWGFSGEWIADQQDHEWVKTPKLDDESQEKAAQLIADGMDHLINTKGYTCVDEFTYINEPNARYNLTYGDKNGIVYYVDFVKRLHQVFIQRGLRNNILFNMSDDTSNYIWLEKCAIELEGVADVLNTHNYQMMDDLTNDAYCNVGTYKLSTVREISEIYEFPILMNEFGVDNGLYVNSGDYASFYSGTRGLTISRQMINAMNNGVVGGTFWTHYTIHNNDPYVFLTYNKTETEIYQATQLYYAFSLFTRLTKIGSEIYYIASSDIDVCACALKSEDGEWTYFAVNTAETDKKVAFANCHEGVGTLNRYLFTAHGNYKDKQQIASDATVSANGRYTETVLPAGSLVALSTL